MDLISPVSEATKVLLVLVISTIFPQYARPNWCGSRQGNVFPATENNSPVDCMSESLLVLESYIPCVLVMPAVSRNPPCFSWFPRKCSWKHIFAVLHGFKKKTSPSTAWTLQASLKAWGWQGQLKSPGWFRRAARVGTMQYSMDILHA